MTVATLALTPGDVHVWRVKLDLMADHPDRMHAMLSEDERLRAERFHRDTDRMRWAASRAALRMILSRYCGEAPESIRFRLSAYGKPALLPESPLRFNLSHSHQLALLAVTTGREVGVDIEHIRTDLDIDLLARNVLAPGEAARLALIPPAERRRAFFAAWCRKEAFAKAAGLGVAFGLSRIEVSLGPGEPAALIAINRPGFAARDWSLQALEPGPEYAGALALQGQSGTYTSFDVPLDARAGHVDVEEQHALAVQPDTPVARREEKAFSGIAQC
jgi:4'-phosphopantetheinyl transferase